MPASPFSLDNGYSLVFRSVPAGWRLSRSALFSLTDRDAEILETLAAFRLCTSLQLLRPFFPTNVSTQGKERLKKLAHRGAVVLHLLECPARKVVLVTPGPLAAEVLGAVWDDSWYRGLDAAAVLRHLVAVELFLRVRQVQPASFLGAPRPFQAVVQVGQNSTEYALLALRRGDGLPPELAWLRPPRLIVIAEDEGQMQAAARAAPFPAAFTHDAAFLAGRLSRAFWRKKAGELVREEVAAFAPPPEEEAGSNA